MLGSFPFLFRHLLFADRHKTEGIWNKHCTAGPHEGKSTSITGCYWCLLWKTPRDFPAPLSKSLKFCSQKLKMTWWASSTFSKAKGNKGASAWPTLHILGMCLCIMWKLCQEKSSSWISMTSLHATGPRHAAVKSLEDDMLQHSKLIGMALSKWFSGKKHIQTLLSLQLRKHKIQKEI